MQRVVVIGGNGRVGRRVISELARTEAAEPVAVDRVLRGFRPDIETHRLDVGRDDLAAVLSDADVVVSVLEDPSRRDDLAAAQGPASALIEAIRNAGVPHVVHVSSALVYGAHADNPVPLTEAAPIRPVLELAPAVVKAELDRAFSELAAPDRSVAVLRPTTTLSPGWDAWLARGLRRGMAVREDEADPPVQFLHLDDLVAAVVLAARDGLAGPFNVAPDGWIGPERFRQLAGGVRVRVGLGRSGQRTAEVTAAARAAVRRPMTEGLDAHVRHPWVVANDRLRAAGWEPAFTNEQAYVAGTSAPPWAAVSPKRRQELALGVSGLGVAGAAAAALSVARRLTR